MNTVWRLWGRRIRAAMAYEDLSQASLAALLEVGQTTVSGWVRGEHPPPDAVKHRLAEVLGVPLGQLFGAEGSYAAARAEQIERSVAS